MHFLIHPQLALAQIINPALQRFKLYVFLLNKTTSIQHQLLHSQTYGYHIFGGKIHLGLPHHAPCRLDGIVRFTDDSRWPILLHRLHRLLRLRLCFWTPPQQTSESALVTRWNGQLYAVVGDETEDGRWQLRLWWKPFVPMIWYGGMLIGLGGLLALFGHVAGDLRRIIARRKIAYRRERQGR